MTASSTRPDKLTIAAEAYIAAARADLEAALRYEDLAAHASTSELRAEYIARAVECRAIGTRKLRSVA